MTFRDETAACPRCQRTLIVQPGCSDGSRLWCEHCRGVLIPTGQLEQILDLTLPTGEPGELPCPRCVAKLARCTLLSLEVDRCVAHGVWFDTGEYLRVLDTLGTAGPQLRRLLVLLYGDPRDA